ncbi:MAG: hypothetical protein AAB696_00260 [Patescibacteria group bacterium]
MPPEQPSNKKGIIYVILLVLILLVVSGIWYIKQSKAAKSFSYQDVIYNCEETGGTAVETGTIIKIAQINGGVPVIVHEGKEYKCVIISDGSKTPDVVLNKTADDVKVFLSDDKGNDVEVKDGLVKVGADGNAVVIDEKGVNVKLKDGGIIEVGEEGNVNINIPGTGSVKIKGGNVETNVPGIGSVKTEGGKIEINTPETGAIKVNDSGEVSVPGVNIPIENTGY